jgi:hypothetical protein
VSKGWVWGQEEPNAPQNASKQWNHREVDSFYEETNEAATMANGDQPKHRDQHNRNNPHEYLPLLRH